MHKLLVIDTETGGLDASTHSILSFGAVVWANGVALDSIEVFVSEPNIVVDAEAIAINGIDIEWLRHHGAAPQDAVKRLEEFLLRNFDRFQKGGLVSLVAHNAAFDVAFLRRLFELAGADYDTWFSHRLLDTASILRFLTIANKVSISGASATRAFEYFGIDINPQERHTALGDAKATAELLTKMIDLVKAR